jgi:hypothetical protein
MVMTASWACGDKGSPTDPGTPEPPVPTTPNRQTGTVGAAGGTVSLPAGTSVVFPAGAVSSSVQVTIERKNPADWFDGPTEMSRVVIATTTSGATTFSQDVEIRAPLAAAMTEADSGSVMAGLINDQTGPSSAAGLWCSAWKRSCANAPPQAPSVRR